MFNVLVLVWWNREVRKQDFRGVYTWAFCVILGVVGAILGVSKALMWARHTYCFTCKKFMFLVVGILSVLALVAYIRFQQIIVCDFR